jgi:hypothetical protein
MLALMFIGLFISLTAVVLACRRLIIVLYFVLRGGLEVPLSITEKTSQVKG